jgi:hypothetical protein
MKVIKTALASLFVVALLTLLTTVSRAQESAPAGGMPAARSWLGDAGHFIQTSPRVFANNPDGRAFTVTVHRHLWKVGGGLSGGTYEFRVLGPNGAEKAAGRVPAGEESATVPVPAGAKGVYEIAVKPSGYDLAWVETSLAQLVAASEPFDAAGKRAFQLHAMVPRRWYFFVPAGTRRFRVRHVIQPEQTHREDFGFFVMSPRGQRVEALFGGKSLEMSPTSGTRPGFTLPLSPVPVTRTIEVDPGTAGRFWSLWIASGDSHNYSDLMLQLDGVPPYFAAAPEQWFDPNTGRAAPVLVYDEAVIRHPDVVDAKGKVSEPYPRYYCTPAPFLGDEDYNGWRGAHTVWLSNPANRKIKLGVQTYLSPPEERNVPVVVRVTGPTAQRLLDQALPLGNSVVIPAAGAGVYRVACDGRRWFPWTHPAPPTVIAGQPTAEGGARFALETGIARHWYFKVPAGTQQFTVAVNVLDPAHVLRVEVHAPDRLQEEHAVRGGQRRQLAVSVAPHLADRIWFLRTEIGSPTRFVSGKGDPRQLNIEADLELHGVPGYLAPTWEQWFDPNKR